MSLATLTRDVATGAQMEVLDRIAQPDTALAIWQRDLPPGLGEALARLDLEAIDDLAIELGVDTPPEDALHAAGYPEALVSPIGADILMLARRHAMVSGVDRLALRLDVVETDACRRFHADYVTLRTLCTYVGPGTQWHRVDEPHAVRQVTTGAVAMFKGRALLDLPAILHRSPPIIVSGERRLLLVIDPA